MASKPKKSGTRKTFTGAQQYSSPKAKSAPTGELGKNYASLAAKAGGKKALEMLGRASEEARHQGRGMRKAQEASSSRNPRKGKPRGGR